MRLRFITQLALPISLLSACETPHSSPEAAAVAPDYYRHIEEYLAQKTVEPNVIINYPDSVSTFNGTVIRWREFRHGVRITIDGHVIDTNDLVTLDGVWGNEPDSLSPANAITQIKYYKDRDDEVTALALRYHPCNGLACGVEYHLLYDHRSGNVSCFGRFHNGPELNLYRFRRSSRLDYLSRTFHGRNSMLRDTTVSTYYSLNNQGHFVPGKNPAGKAYYFRHMYSESDSIPESFDEQWVDTIYKPTRHTRSQ